MRKKENIYASSLGIILITTAHASSAELVVSTPTTTSIDLAGNSLSITAAGSIAPGGNPFAPIYLNQSLATSITNDGLIQGSNLGCSADTPCLYEGAISNVGGILTGSIINNGNIFNTGPSAYAILLRKQNRDSPNVPIIQGGIINNGTMRTSGTENTNVINLASSSSGATVSQGIVNSGLMDVASGSIFASVIRLNGNTQINGGITNSGTMTSVGRGISGGGTLDFIDNTGIISTTSDAIQPNYNPASPNSIQTITNQGTITSINGFSINNDVGTPINRLNNYQGLNGSGGAALTYNGSLPAFYEIITHGSNYGQLAVSSAAAPRLSTTMTFGVYGSSSLQAITYQNVISGVSSSLINPTSLSGNFGPYSWNLQQTTATSGIWNLFVSSIDIIPTAMISDRYEPSLASLLI